MDAPDTKLSRSEFFKKVKSVPKNDKAHAGIVQYKLPTESLGKEQLSDIMESERVKNKGFKRL